MKKFLLPICLFCVFLLGILIVKGGDNKKTVVVPVKDVKAEKRKADSIYYSNLTTDTKDNTYQNTPNEVLLSNGMKITFIKLNRFSIPRGVNVIIPDEMSQRFLYELAEVEMKATNTTSYEMKLGQTASDALFVSMKVFSVETTFKPFSSQYPLSFGSIYSMMEPAQTEKVTPMFQQTTAFMNNNYKPGETKTSKGVILCLAKAAKKIDRIVVQTQEFGANKTYVCPATL